eukprot:490259_1
MPLFRQFIAPVRITTRFSSRFFGTKLAMKTQALPKSQETSIFVSQLNANQIGSTSDSEDLSTIPLWRRVMQNKFDQITQKLELPNEVSIEFQKAESRHRNSLSVIHPKLAREFHPSKNRDINPTEIAATSTQRIWWQCRKNQRHEFQASPLSRTCANSIGCPYCSGLKLSPELSLAEVAPGIAAEFHPTKNLDLTPLNTHAKSKTQVWWQCPRDTDHVYQATVLSRSKKIGHRVFILLRPSSHREAFACPPPPRHRRSISPGQERLSPS